MSRAASDHDGQSAVGLCACKEWSDVEGSSEEFTAKLRELVEQVAQAHKSEIAAVRYNLESGARERMSPSSIPSEPLRRVQPPPAEPAHVVLPMSSEVSRSNAGEVSPPMCSPVSSFMLGGGGSHLQEPERSMKSKQSEKSIHSLNGEAWLSVNAAQIPATLEPSRKVADLREVRWQWMHRTGWRDYQRHESDNIESAYQAGRPKARMKSGKGGTLPMEIFFKDMLQHDNRSDQLRDVRRLGPDPWWQRLRRYIWSFYHEFESGVSREETFMSYRRSTILHKQTVSMRDRKGFFSRKFTEFEAGLVKQRQFCRRVTESVAFTMFTMTIVALNTLWMGIELNQSPQARREDTFFIVMEQFFCTVFSVEVLLRFGAFEDKWKCLHDKWFFIDSLCTLSMVFEAWVVPLLEVFGLVDGLQTVNIGVIRALRLCRITRMARLVKAMPEFATMMKGIATALRSVGVTLVMLVTFLYMFGIIFRSQVESGSSLEREYFSSTQHSMWTLLLHGTLLDAVSIVAEEVLAQSAFLAAMFLLSIFVTSFTVLNMLIGIIVGVVTAVKGDESERKAKRQLQHKLKDIMDVYDSDCTKTLNRSEFGLFIANPDVQRVLRDFEVDHWGLINLSEHLFDDANTDGSLSFEQILDVVVRLRGDNKIRMADVVQLRKFTDQKFEKMKEAMTKDLDGTDPDVKDLRSHMRLHEMEGDRQEPGSAPADRTTLPGCPE